MVKEYIFKNTDYKDIDILKNLLENVSVEVIIDRSIRIAKDYYLDKYINWGCFFWAFNKAFREIENKRLNMLFEVSRTFPIYKILSKDQRDYIAIELKINEDYNEENYYGLI